LLADHHHEVEGACRVLLACARADDPRALIEQYRLLERAVLEHLQAEEAVILPAFAAHDPDGARAIRDEHGAIRELLFRISVGLELHAVRVEQLEQLIETLHAHAAREDALVYPWAQVHLPLTAKRRLFVQIPSALTLSSRGPGAAHGEAAAVRPDRPLAARGRRAAGAGGAARMARRVAPVHIMRAQRIIK
jgi:Hemerythrin HHE cation binding domain